MVTVVATGTKTVTVGAQSGTLTAGVGGSVTFTVTTTNIANGTYTATVANRPTGVSVSGSVVISSNSGTLTLTGNTSTVTGTTTTLSLNINGTTSAPFILTIAPAATKTVKVGAQSGTLTAGVAGNAFYEVSISSNISSSIVPTVQWYNSAAGTTTATAPAGVTTTTGNPGNYTYDLDFIIRTTTATPAGTYYFRITMEGTQSNVATLVVGAAATKTITVGAQSGTMTAGVVGLVTFPVTTSGIADGNYNATASVANLPTDVQFVSLSINNNAGTMMFGAGSGGVANTVAGTYNTLCLTLDGATSAAFTLTISASAPDGTASNPFIVNSVATLQKVASGTDGWTRSVHYKQTGNINMNGVTWSAKGDNTQQFTGSYDGGGYSISNLNPGSLFGFIGTGGAVRNLALISVNITYTTVTAGGIARQNYGTIENCYVSGSISGESSVGGIAGRMYSGGVIKNCYTTCNVTGSSSEIGGIVGLNSGSTIVNSYATGKMTGTSAIGGIVGRILSSSGSVVQNNVALNYEVSATNSNTYVGRVIGNNESGTLTPNYARASGMTLTGSSGAVTVTPSATGIHGEDVTAVNYFGVDASTWWGSTAGYSATNWDIANRLPHLKTTTGGTFDTTYPQNPTVITP